MPQSQYRARQVGDKTREVMDYDHDESLPGKPLHILIPGGLIALAALGVIILVIYRTWFENELAQSTAIPLLVILAPFYIGGVFLFSYGYELYNIPRALRLTAIIVFVTLAAVVIIAVLFVVLGAGGKGLSGGSSDKKKSSSDKPQAKSTSSSTSSSRGSSFPAGVGDVVILGGGRTRTREVVREVERKVEVPVAPRSIDCLYCKRSYVPAENNYACPACGAATPKDQIEESEAPRDSSGM